LLFEERRKYPRIGRKWRKTLVRRFAFALRSRASDYNRAGNFPRQFYAFNYYEFKCAATLHPPRRKSSFHRVSLLRAFVSAISPSIGLRGLEFPFSFPLCCILASAYKIILVIINDIRLISWKHISYFLARARSCFLREVIRE